jgi:hypothetical protein
MVQIEDVAVYQRGPRSMRCAGQLDLPGAVALIGTVRFGQEHALSILCGVGASELRHGHGADRPEMRWRDGRGRTWRWCRSGWLDARADVRENVALPLRVGADRRTRSRRTGPDALPKELGLSGSRSGHRPDLDRQQQRTAIAPRPCSPKLPPAGADWPSGRRVEEGRSAGPASLSGAHPAA